jgi:hypothetical protein
MSSNCDLVFILDIDGSVVKGANLRQRFRQSIR